MIQVNALTKRFDDHLALSNVNLHVKKGSIYGMVGPNGAGKTTIIKHITGVYIPDKGSVLVNGEPVYDNQAVKQRLIYIPDDLYFPPTFSAMDMAKLYSQIYENFSWDRFHELKKLFDINTDKRVAKLSKGMQKQVSFWICMSTNPEVIILDEPVDGLDPVMRRQVWGVMMQDVEERGTTVLISSHNLRELEDVCDHVGILHKGQMMLEKALDDVKSDIHKLQVAFEGDINPELLNKLDILNQSTLGKVNMLIVRGKREEVLKTVEAYQPILVDILPLTLEEVFIYELGGKGYDFQHILH